MSQELIDLLEEISDSPKDKHQISLLEKAIRYADFEQKTSLAFSLRLKLTSAALKAGVPEKGLVAFAWCAAKASEDPDEYEDLLFFKHYHWAISCGIASASVSDEVLMRMIRDFAERMARRNSMQGSKRFDEMTPEILAENLGVLKERYQKWKKQWEEETR